MLNKYFTQDWVDAIGQLNLMSMLSTINSQLSMERVSKDVLPKAGDPLLFQAFRETPYNDVKVVILGQD